MLHPYLQIIYKLLNVLSSLSCSIYVTFCKLNKLIFFLGPNTRPVSPYQSNESPFVMDKSSIQFPFGNRPEPSQEALLAEIKRLRERLVTLEADNASMSLKLSQQQWEVQNRLAEIELHICSTAPTPGQVGPPSEGSASGDDFERKESMI